MHFFFPSHHDRMFHSRPSSPASSASSPSTSSGTSSESASPQPEPQAQQGHIPRPRNAFIIFRSHFYAQARVSQCDNNSINQNALSCAAAVAWKELPEEEKKSFRKLAEDEKLLHYKKHPNYVYTPLNKSVKRAQKKINGKKSAKPPVKRHRSSLSQRSRKAESLRSTKRSSSPDDDSTPTVVPYLELTQDEKCYEGSKIDSESQKRVDLQFGQRPDVSFIGLPPTPTADANDCEPILHSPPVTPELSDSDNPGYPNWMYNELVGCGMPDTGLHAGWNPIQTTLNAYGDDYFNHDQQPSNDFDDFSRYVNYDNMDTPTASAYSFGETTNADATFTGNYPYPSYDGNWVGLQ